MGLVVPNSVETAVLTTLLTPALTIRLYGNNKTPAAGDSTGAYTEIVGGGYAAKPLTFANWGITANAPSVALYNTTQNWTFTGVINAPGSIYGYYITRNSDNALILAERFASAVVPFAPIAGSQVRVLPRITCASQFGD